MHKATRYFFSSPTQIDSTWKQSRFLFGVCSEVQDPDFRLKLPLGLFISILMLSFTVFFFFFGLALPFQTMLGVLSVIISSTCCQGYNVLFGNYYYYYYFLHGFIIDITFIIHELHVILIVLKKKILTNFIFKHLIFCWKEKYLYWLEKYF